MLSNGKHKQPSLFISLIPLITMGLFLGIGYGVLKIRAEVLLIGSAAVAGLLAKWLGFTWRELEQGIVESIRQAMPAMLIVICVGMLIGSWIASGTIPMLIFYGLKLISPKFFLVTACMVCSVISLVTGTSWGTVGTIGIAFIGIAQGLGIPLGAAAGAIVAGAYFGDKISPFSDTTNLAPIAAKSNLFDHVRHLLWTTTPAWIIGLTIYFVVGLQFEGPALPKEQLERILATLQMNFHFHILLLLPAVVVLYFAVRKLPTIPGMVAASALASLLALFFQKGSFQEILNAMTVGYTADTGVAEIDRLLSRGGMMSMMGVTLIAFCAFAFAGIVQKAGMLNVILDHLLKIVKSTGSLIASVVGSCVTVALITGSSFLSIIVPGELFAPAFKQRNLAAKNLSRTTEDSGTVVVPLIPWSMAGIYMSGTLGVATLDYAPWAFMCYLGVVFALIYGFTGFAIAPKVREDETIPGS
ncbi:MAG: Na+/H+ antiporter NhaC [candidate division KSB1 bacterium]|nr:Na+/H+ antiporter NhaC [candidate division KSB1 bacterium]MDZ7358738.1 Na+/H+ antiporter NhaC [candidate division KSB1 bacterium]MDZ7401979.1 Na+/H+ antiporter NhaC [candidate division KSB1 bacterium]